MKRAFDVLLKVAGGALAIAMAIGSAVLEVLATPGPWYLPMLMALAGNLFLAWFAMSTVERWWAWMLPAVPWVLIMLVAIAPTSEGDQLANSGAGLGTFAVGTIAFFLPLRQRRHDHNKAQEMGVSGISH